MWNYPIQEQELLTLIYAFEDVETLLVWHGENSLYLSFLSCYLGNPPRTLCNESSSDRALVRVSRQDCLPKGLNIVHDASSRGADYKPINSISDLEMTDTIREIKVKDKLFRDIPAYFCDADEKIPSSFCQKCIATALTLRPSFFTSFLKENDDCVYQETLNFCSWSCMSNLTFRLLLILDLRRHTKR